MNKEDYELGVELALTDAGLIKQASPEDFMERYRAVDDNTAAQREFLQKNLPNVFRAGGKTYVRTGVVEPSPLLSALGAGGGGLAGLAGGSLLGGLAGGGVSKLLDTDERTSVGLGALLGGLGGAGLGGYTGYRMARPAEEDIGKLRVTRID